MKRRNFVKNTAIVTGSTTAFATYLKKTNYQESSQNDGYFVNLQEDNSGSNYALSGKIVTPILFNSNSGDGTTDATSALFNAESAVGSKGSILLSNGTFFIQSNITLNALLIFQGAKLKPDSGVIVTLNQVPHASPTEIFDLSAGGEVKISSSAPGTVEADWFGLSSSYSLGTDVAKPLQALFDASKNKIVRFNYKANFTFRTRLIVRQNTTFDNQARAIFEADLDLSNTSNPALKFEQQCDGNFLQINIPSGKQHQRTVVFGLENQFDTVYIKSVDQQSTVNDSIDALVQIRGNYISLGRLVVENADHAITAFDCNYILVNNLDITSYLRGLKIESVNGFWLYSGHARTISPNAGPHPGHNGFLAENSNNWHVTNYTVEDSGEHGFRIGGDNSNNWSWVNCASIKPGQCGFKVNPSGNGVIRDGLITGCWARDCSWGNASGTNEDGLRLEKCRNVTVEGFKCYTSTGSKAYDGIFINGCHDITINNPYINTTARDCIRIVDSDREVNNIHISSPRLINPSEALVTIDHSKEILEDITILEIYGHSQGTYGINVQVADVDQPCIFSGYIRNDGSNAAFKKTANSLKSSNRIYDYIQRL